MANITKSWTKFVIGFDPHGAYQDTKANAAFFKFIEHYKPQLRIAGGDIFDFKQLRSKASDVDKGESMKHDVDEGTLWLEKLKPTVWLHGNHDERLWDTAERAKEGVIKDYANEGINNLDKLCRKMDCQQIKYDIDINFYQLGASNVRVTHGFHHGKYAARMATQDFGCSIIQGHGHNIQYSSSTGMGQTFGMMGGCLCNKNPEYAKSFVQRRAWRHGWVYGVVSGKHVEVWQAKETNGMWVLPTGMESL